MLFHNKLGKKYYGVRNPNLSWSFQKEIIIGLVNLILYFCAQCMPSAVRRCLALQNRRICLADFQLSCPASVYTVLTPDFWLGHGVYQNWRRCQLDGGAWHRPS